MEKPLIAGFRLTTGQRRLWALAQQGLAPRIACLVELGGDLAPDHVRRAVERVAQRHEMLRATFSRRPGMKFPLQVLTDTPGAGWSEEDLSGLPGPEAGERLEALWRRELVRGASPGEAPLSAVLVSSGDGSRSLLLSASILCADSFSLRRIAEETALLCAGRRNLEDAVPYLDVAEWQEDLLASDDEEAARGRAFWRRQDASALRSPVLPFEAGPGRGSGERREAAPACLPVEIGSGLLARLDAAGARYGASRVDLLRLAWWILLARLCGEPVFLVHELFDGRSDEQLLSVVGPLARWLPKRVELDESQTVQEALRRADRLHRESREWQHHLEWPEEPDLAAEEAVVGFEAESWSLAVRRRQPWSDPLKAVLSCLDTGEGLEVELRYDAGRLLRADMEHAAAQLTVLLEGLSGPVPSLGALRLAGEAEERLMAELGRGEALPVAGRTIHRLIEEQAARVPTAPAVIHEDRVLSYGDLNGRANRLGRALRRLGVAPDTPVALFMERSPDLLVGMLAILKAGGAYVPLDASQPARRLAMELEDLSVRAVVTESRLAPRLPALPVPVLRIDADWEEIARQPDGDLEGGALPESLAYIIFTSGSTGRPKGVMVEHRQLLNYLAGIRDRLALEPGWSYASVSTFAADLGHTAIFPALTSGGCLHLIAGERAVDPTGLAEYFERHAVDCLKIVPTHLEALHASVPPERLLPRRRLVLGGEASQVRRGEELRRAAGSERRVFNHYGPSETTVGVLTYAVPETVDGRCRTLPIGRPLPNTRAHLLDREGRRVSVWEPGEIHIGGAGVARGYYGCPDLTAQSFLPDPFATEPGMRMYRSGDLARLLPEGSVEFLGRRDHQIKLHGFRVELNEIRSLLNAHPQIRDSVVLAKRDQNGGDALIAYYVSRQELELGELRSWLAQGLAAEILPNFFVHLRKLPLTPNGKIDHQALPSLEEIKQQAKTAFIAPRTETEEVVAKVWSEVLGVHPVSAEANFFALGGHSLLATRIISRLRETYRVDLPLRVMFDTPTVAGIARSVASRVATAGTSPVITRVDRSLEDELAELERLSEEQARGLVEGAAADRPREIPG